MRLALAALSSLLSIGALSIAQGAPDVQGVTLTLKGHRFTPDVVEVRAGARIRIDLINQDPATEEFDSEDLHVEKDVTPNGKVSFVIGPLAAGTYGFMGELHPETAKGTIRAVAAP